MKSINPWNQELVFERKASSEAEVDASIALLNESFTHWRSSPVIQRCAFVLGLAAALKENKSKWAELMTLEMGKPLSQAKREIDKCIWLCEHHAKHAPRYLADEYVETGAKKALVRHQALGIVYAVMPWNYPFWQVLRAAVPAILAGNTVLLKHASNVSACSEALEKAFQLEGFPALFKSVFVAGADASKIAEDARIKGVTLTGSLHAGSSLAKTAAGLIKPTLLELGGSNAMIITEKADFDKSIALAVQGRFQNNGQSCIAVKRLLVHESWYERTKIALEKAIRNMSLGDPLTDPDIGPMAREDLAEELEEQCRQSIATGATALFEIKREQALFHPNALFDCQPGMRAFDEELFGPVLSVTPFSSFEEAIELSNHGPFGLGVSIMCDAPEEYLSLCSKFDEGAVFFNAFVKSDPNLPFGGVKTSGYGRELGQEGILSFVNKQTIVIE